MTTFYIDDNLVKPITMLVVKPQIIWGNRWQCCRPRCQEKKYGKQHKDKTWAGNEADSINYLQTTLARLTNYLGSAYNSHIINMWVVRRTEVVYKRLAYNMNSTHTHTLFCGVLDFCYLSSLQSFGIFLSRAPARVLSLNSVRFSFAVHLLFPDLIVFCSFLPLSAPSCEPIVAIACFHGCTHSWWERTI